MTMTSHLNLLTVLICALIVRGLARDPSRGECKRTASFKKVQDRKLTGHVIATHNVTCSHECADECLRTIGCKSYNYQEIGSPHHVCELNSQSKSFVTSSSSYVIQNGYSYYDAEQYVLPACLSSPCKNGGTCRIAGCSDDYTCDCKEKYSGEHCQTWIGSDGSSSGRPGHSCAFIKYYGKAKQSGDYWIDPTRSGSPFQVKCDMTTDGGGWTVVRNATLQSSSPSGSQSMSSYRYMRQLDWYKLIDASVLKSLHNDMGFRQMRIYCRKKAVKTTVHVMTAMNDIGSNVIRYFIDGSPIAIACNSYIRMPDDTSYLSKHCSELGYASKGVKYLNRWGNQGCCAGDYRLVNRLLNIPAVSKTFSCSGVNYFCDDMNQNNCQPGDMWLLFVR